MKGGCFFIPVNTPNPTQEQMLQEALKHLDHSNVPSEVYHAAREQINRMLVTAKLQAEIQTLEQTLSELRERLANYH